MTAHEGKVLYTAGTRTVGVLQAQSSSDDGRLDIRLSAPGAGGSGTNPEQLLAAGWSSCFILAMNLAAGRLGAPLPADTAVDAEVDLCNSSGDYNGTFFIKARLSVTLPGVDPDLAWKILDAAHDICPYHQATRGNVDVEVSLV